MDLSIADILRKCVDLPVVQERARRDNYAELVFPTKDTGKWAEALKVFFGEAAKPAGENPTKDQEKLTDEFGGVKKGQTLFCKPCEDKFMIAMFWPWGNGEHTTLKLAVTTAPKKGLFNFFSKSA